jgi:hypothetical protein
MRLRQTWQEALYGSLRFPRGDTWTSWASDVGDRAALAAIRENSPMLRDGYFAELAALDGREAGS